MGAPGRYARAAAVGGFSDSPSTTFSSSGLFAGSDTCTVILVLQILELDLGGVFASCANVGGWYIGRDAAEAYRLRLRDGTNTTRTLVTPAGSVRQGLQVLIARKDATTGYMSVDGGAETTEPCAGWTPDSPPVNRIGSLAASGTSPAAGAGVHALLTADNSLLDAADVADCYAQVKDNLAQGRDLRSGGLGFDPQWYWDARDWPGYGDWVDRIAGAALPPVGEPQRFEFPGRAA